jgi:hypothetical protein
MPQALEGLLRQHEALSSSPSTIKTQIKTSQHKFEASLVYHVRPYLKISEGPGVVIHVCNPRHSGGGGRRITV